MCAAANVTPFIAFKLAGAQKHDSVVGVSSAYSNVEKDPKKVPSYMSIIRFKAGHS